MLIFNQKIATENCDFLEKKHKKDILLKKIKYLKQQLIFILNKNNKWFKICKSKQKKII